MAKRWHKVTFTAFMKADENEVHVRATECAAIIKETIGENSPDDVKLRRVLAAAVEPCDGLPWEEEGSDV